MLLFCRQRVLAATGVSRTTYQRICKEAKEIESEDNPSTSFSTPRKRRRPSVVVDAVSIGEIEQIREIIYNCIIIEKRRPTLKCK